MTTGNERRRYGLWPLLVLPMLLAACAGPAQRPAVGTEFRDGLRQGGLGPVMVVLPAGSFIMGSPDGEAGRYANEGPRHRVHIERPFALGRTEVTVGEFRRFVEASGYVTSAEGGEGSFFRDPATGDWRLEPRLDWRFDSAGRPAEADLPVVHVSWDDAQAYARWLTQQSGAHYRLPSEAELEYANRAGSQSAFPWGEGAPPAALANIKGEGDRPVTAPRLWRHTADEERYARQEGPTPDVFRGYADGFGAPAPVGRFPANAFGLQDTAGNVWEWAADCWHADYRGAPGDGRAWEAGGDCERRVVRGGSWYCYPRHIRAANRWARWPIFRNMYIGIRLARDL